MDKPLTITDVAERAGVSLSTVSRVMNGNTTVDPKLARRVRKAARELNYNASPLARSLVLGRTQTVSVLVPDLGNPTFQAFLGGLSRSAAGSDYHVLIADTSETVTEEIPLARELRRRTDGLILCGPRSPGAELSQLVHDLSPVVVINRAPNDDYPVVAVDNKHGMTQVIDHLYELGHRRVAYLAGAALSSSNTQRVAALRDFAALHPDIVLHELECGAGFGDGAAALDKVSAAGVSAVLAFNDLVAMGLMGAAQRTGISIPQDLSIVGFDDITFAGYANPPLSTVAVPAERLGQEAWLNIKRILSGTSPARTVCLKPDLVIRGSSGPPETLVM